MSEQEKFEAWFERGMDCRLSLLSQTGALYFKDGEYNQSFLVNAAWKAWQAATAQAVPEGYVVVPEDATGAMENKTLWAVNIPEEPDSEELLFAATSKEHAQSIVSRLHNEIFETYPTFGEAIADSIYVTEWHESAEEHVESLATKWWEHTTFLGSE